MTLDPVRLARSDTWIEGTVMHIDRFGNATTNIPDSWLNTLPSKICTWVDDRPICRRVDHYQELPDGRPGFLRGSRGTLELALNGASLAERWQLSLGAVVRVQAGGRPQSHETQKYG